MAYEFRLTDALITFHLLHLRYVCKPSALLIVLKNSKKHNVFYNVPCTSVHLVRNVILLQQTVYKKNDPAPFYHTPCTQTFVIL